MYALPGGALAGLEGSAPNPGHYALAELEQLVEEAPNWLSRN